MKTRRFFAASVLAMTLVAIPTIAAQARDISSADEFRQFAADVKNNANGARSETVNITGTIDFANGTLDPIGTESTPFTGTINGGGNVIKNVTVSTDVNTLRAGIFGYIQDATIDNLNFENVTVTNASSDGEDTASGIVTATARSSTLSNITVGNTCTVSGQYRTGGITGETKRTGCEITNCTSYATINGNMYVGGIVGAMHDLVTATSSGTVSNCHNYGIIDGQNEVGGIAGYTNRATVTECTNNAAVTGAGNYGVGGIVGYDAFNRYIRIFVPRNGSTIEKCNNYAEVRATSTSGRVGGVLGTYSADPGDSKPLSIIYSNITDCNNSGDIYCAGTKAGAIFGYQQTYASGDSDTNINTLGVKITNCKNTGEVFAPNELAEAPLSGSNISVTIIQ